MAGRDHGPYYGPNITCCGCGDSWSCGELLPRPFRRGWRTAEIAKAKRAWTEAGLYTAAGYKAWLADELAAVIGGYGSSVEDVSLPESAASA
ncbi:hypothetical protein ACFWMH_27695 [Streptomyces tendae]|uniref:hypothetical protein n=1 Tax=Streptomyces tendae TaxID=1932 RepID=UPI0036696FB3